MVPADTRSLFRDTLRRLLHASAQLSRRVSETGFERSLDHGDRIKFGDGKPKSRGSVLKTIFSGTIILCTLGLLVSSCSVSFGTEEEAALFNVAVGEHPVFNTTDARHFANTPLSSLRPKNQFTLEFSDWTTLRSLFATGAKPVLSVITVTRNPQEVFLETASFMKKQSLRPLSWIIVNDHSDSKYGYDLLVQAANADPRIRLVNSSRPAGFVHGRLFALEYLQKFPTKFFVFLDDDDMYELTGLEKCVWMLESNENTSMCGSFVVGFGAKNYTWERGFHNGAAAYLQENPLTGSEVIRTDVVKETGCSFDPDLEDGMEDWDFYLCVASRGKWGATIPEVLFWYRQNPNYVRKQRWKALFGGKEQTAELIRNRYKSLTSSFPVAPIRSSEVFETIPTEFPFRNPLNLQKSVLFILPWTAIGGADSANLNLVRELSTRGYRVTIVCTLLEVHGVSMSSKPLFMQYTHDIFYLPAMLRLVDVPRFLSYLIESRNVQLVFVSNSQLGYGVLPWLSAKYDKIRFIDYVHNEEPDWKNGGYAAFSVIHQASLDGTFTSSQKARQYMIDHGHSPEAVHTGYLGIDMSKLEPFSNEKRRALRKKIGLRADAVVVVFVARMVEHKRPRIALEAFMNVIEKEKMLIKKGKLSDIGRFCLLLIGGGPKLGELEGLASKANAHIRVLGALEHDKVVEYLGVSDIFCLPSVSEGISFALAEAMALGLTPLASDIGGNPELVGRDGRSGILVPTSENSAEDANIFADKMHRLVTDRALRQRLGRRAYTRVRNMFDASLNIPELTTRILRHPLTRQRVGIHANDLSSLYYAHQIILEELRVHSDFKEIQQSLSGKPRTGYGLRYRATCGEYNDIMTTLIDFLEKPKACIEDQELDVQAIQSYALGQCGQWCIMDLSDTSRNSGWQVSEGCQGLVMFNDVDHECSKWYKVHGSS